MRAKTTLISLGLLAVSAGTAVAENPMNGTWVIGDGTGKLTIHGSRWNHDKFGAGTIQKGTGSAHYEVFYNKHQGVRCAYRITTIADGAILVLEAADETQSADYCPQGKLSRADK
ncbi:MAG: hypothetical protein JNL45_04855 [Hyphomicrobium sp.]|nr:hypothetical protein [Hyphomicrobium sp.]